VSFIGWNGQDDQSVFVPPGRYALELSASPVGGFPFSPAAFCKSTEVIAAPPLDLFAGHGPLIPEPGGLVQITANALDGLHGDRRTGTIELWVATAAQISVASPPQSPQAQCQSLAVCITNVLNIAGSMTATRFAYRAVAYDIGGDKVETPWRLVDMVPADRFGPGASATPVMAGVVSDPLGTVRQDQAIDITFYPGSGFNVDADEGRFAFFAAAATHVRTIMGAGGTRFPSSVLTRQKRFNVWVSPRSVAVTQSQPNAPTSPGNFCNIGSIETAPFAEANGVIHRVVCRDNAPGNKYTANAAEISWHELHHAAFGLADEYWRAGPPEVYGGYWQASPFPNLYFWPGDCTKDPLSGGTCNALRPAGSWIPTQNTRWWRIDQGTNDVMWDNTIEQATDLRRAMWQFDQCDAGRC